MTDDIKNQAIAILDNMREIVRNDMLLRGQYLTDHVARPDLKEQGAVCGGHQACAVGSLYLAGGVKPRRYRDHWGEYVYELPGVEAGHARRRYLRRKPALRAAYDALNAAAERYCKRHKIDLREHHNADGQEIDNFDVDLFGAMESLFEASYTDWDYVTVENRPVLDLAELPKIITSAKRALRAA